MYTRLCLSVRGRLKYDCGVPSTMKMFTDRNIKQILDDWMKYVKICYEEPQEWYVTIPYFNQLLTDLLAYIVKLEKRIDSLELEHAVWG